MQVNHNRFLGYTKDDDGNLIIEPTEAAVIKRIYREYLEGDSLLTIRRGLEADGIRNGAGNLRWHESNIKQILTNEKYIGDALLQKTYTVSILEKKRAANNGSLPKYYVEGCHEPIIEKSVYLKVQSEMATRANLNAGGKKRVYSGKYALSSIVFCGHCGDIYRRIKWNNRGCKSTVWRCVSRVEKGGPYCPARTVQEETLHRAVITAVNDVFSGREEIIPVLLENIRSVLDGGIDDRLADIDAQIRLKQTELLEAGRDEEKCEAIGDTIIALREERQELLTGAALKKDLAESMEDLSDFLNVQTAAVTEYTEPLARRLIEKITIFDEKMVVRFKCGLEVEVAE